MKTKLSFKTIAAAAGVTMLSLVGVSQAIAATATGTMAVSAAVVPVCSVATTALSFGNYDGTVDVAATSSFTVDCSTAMATITFAVDGGNHGSATDFGMDAGGVDILRYGLFGEVGLITPIDPNSSVVQVGPVFPMVNTFYGNIAAGQVVPAGPYSDTLTFSATW